MSHETLIRTLSQGYADNKLTHLLRRIAPTFRPGDEPLDFALRENEPFSQARQLGTIAFDDATTVLVAAVRVEGELTARTSKRRQYDLAKRVLKATHHNAGIFAFHDDAGRFRLSLVTVTYHGTRRQFSTYRRYTFFVDPDLPNKTFFQQFCKADFSTLAGVLETFSIEAVSEAFYQEFKPKFDHLAAEVRGTTDDTLKKDFALLFVIRTIFLGFVQKKGWLGGKPRFLQDYWDEYQAWKQASGSQENFYREWLEPLFFEALSSPPGQKVAYGRAPFSPETQRILQMAPYLNGELFKRKRGIDDQRLWIPDALIGEFLDFLFQYNFTVEENELYDEELELNPEFLGIIFERLTNMEQGAVYTPRVEVDMMSRLALVKWLERTTSIPQETLYRLFFPGQEKAVLTPEQVRTLIERLKNVTVCDPAAGSGAFEVGMLQVLDRTLEDLYQRDETPADLKAKAVSAFERKKGIIARSLYGVEVKRWAVWINHLRLWLSLFVDIPDKTEEDRANFRYSQTPLLPNLTFKVRVGDSLVQRIGDKTFPVSGHADVPTHIKRRITQLKQKKRDFFYNHLTSYALIEQEEINIFRAILDAEIEAKRKEIQKLKHPSAAKLFDLAPTAAEEAQAQAKAERIAQLEAEITELEAQKRSLQEERPFIWSIEFAEIFFDRGGFDIIIGNPPYVRQEEITDPNGRLSPREYKAALMEMVRLDFPEYFAKSRAQTNEFRTNRKPDGRSDLYTYFYIRSLRLLNPQGAHVFICSNSWLDVGYGAWIQEFFLRKAPLYSVIDNHARRSFARADINTVITVAGAPLRRGHVPPDHVVRFVAFKKPFEEVINAENFLTIERAQKVLKTPDFRVFPITVKELLEEGSEPTRLGPGKYRGDKWGGKYLRAPDIFFTILEKGKGKLVRLGEVAEVRFGIKTGANEFFYLEPLGPGSRPGLVRVRNGAGWEGEIEEEFLKPVIKSPREIKTIVIDPTQLKYRLFMCHKSKRELKGTKALEYIEWGEKRKYHKRPSCKGRKFWYSLSNESDKSRIVPLHFNYLINEVGRTFVGNIYASDNFHDISLPADYAAYLNSSVFFLFQNITGRTNFGGGLLKIQTFELSRMLLLVEVKMEHELLNRLQNRSIFAEYGIDPTMDIPIAKQAPKPLPERKALDDIMFDALGLTEEERKEVYRAVAQLVWERISRARSV